MDIKRVGIVGSGTMGSGIAEVAAKNGFEVVLRSRSQSSADGMVQGLEKSLNKQVEKGRLSEGDRDAALARVRGVTDLKELAECDIVVESVVEDLEVKKELFQELDRIVKADDKGEPVTVQLGRLRSDVRGVIGEVRDTLYDLRTDVSERDDLVAIVEEAVDEVTADEAGATGNDAFHRNIRDANAQRNRPGNVE
jgi:NAD(P)-dependent dehydrogenase (short-subunit alcohol dehydrogenase family)